MRGAGREVVCGLRVDRRGIEAGQLERIRVVIVKTSRHSAGWPEEFCNAVTALPEIVDVHRLTGNFDSIMKMVLPNVEHDDTHLQTPLFEMSAYISMEP